MLVIGLGGAVLEVGSALVISGTALSAVVGIILNLVLPAEENNIRLKLDAKHQIMAINIRYLQAETFAFRLFFIHLKLMSMLYNS